jgi:hypothetical protein
MAEKAKTEKKALTNEVLKTYLTTVIEKLTALDAKVELMKKQMTTQAGGKKKKVKDPNAPKRARNGYMFYIEENRAKVHKENPSKQSKELTQILAKEWNALNDKEKAKYMEKAKADRERYTAEKAKYTAKKN